MGEGKDTLRTVVFLRRLDSRSSFKFSSKKFVAAIIEKLSLHPLLKKSNGLVVQLVRMPPCHGGGRGFESRPVRNKCKIALVSQSLTRAILFLVIAGVVVLVRFHLKYLLPPPTVYFSIGDYKKFFKKPSQEMSGILHSLIQLTCVNRFLQTLNHIASCMNLMLYCPVESVKCIRRDCDRHYQVEDKTK